MAEARIAPIEKCRDLALIERPQCKRRWSTEPWEKQQERALRHWLLDRLEARHRCQALAVLLSQRRGEDGWAVER